MDNIRWFSLPALLCSALLMTGCGGHADEEPGFVDVDSTVIEAISYDDSTNTLTIRFIEPRAVYGYSGVPAPVYIEFLESESKGRYFHESIKGMYEEGILSD